MITRQLKFLREAVERKDQSAVKQILINSPYLFHVDALGLPIMHLCLKSRLADQELLSMYFKSGGKATAKTGSGDSLLLLGHLHGLSEDGISLLRSRGADLTAYERAVIVLSCETERHKRDSELLNVLTTDPGIVHNIEPDGTTLLHRAIDAVSSSVVLRIIEFGANVNQLTSNGVSVMGLLGVCFSDDDRLKKEILLRFGARPTIEEHLAILLITGKNDEVVRILNSDRGLIHAWVTVWRCPLSLVCLKNTNSVLFFKYFVENGFDINGADAEGKTALHIESFKSTPNPSFLEYLRESGAIIDLNDDREYTPLHYAVTANEDTAFWLIDSGASINGLTAFGDTPLDVIYSARMPGFGKFGAQLKKRGALRASELVAS